jgi:hypothetical protein
MRISKIKSEPPLGKEMEGLRKVLRVEHGGKEKQSNLTAPLKN